MIIRTVFACEPSDEAEVRRGIVAGLCCGDGERGSAAASWTLLNDAASAVRETEADLAKRLAAPPAG